MARVPCRASGLVQYLFCDPNILRHDRDRSSNGTTSVVGQTRRFDLLSITSDMPSTSDLPGPGQHFAKGPSADMPAANIARCQQEIC